MVVRKCVLFLPLFVFTSAMFAQIEQLQISSQDIQFGAVGIGHETAANQVTIKNMSGGELSPIAVQANGDFVQLNNCNAPLAQGASCTIDVKFTPQAPGVKTGHLVVSAGEYSQSAELIGFGQTLDLNPSDIVVQPTQVGTTSPATTIELKNVSTSSVTLSSVNLGGEFSQTNDCPAQLNAGDSCHLNIRFTPTAQGERESALTITTSSPSDSFAKRITGSAYTQPTN
jgi:hypothetical protein